MTHEPECATYHPSGDGFDLCICDRIRAAYQRGLADGEKVSERIRKYHYEAGYREGYNDHARSRAYAEQVYGPYPTGEMVTMPKATFESITEHVIHWNQHGKGENP